MVSFAMAYLFDLDGTLLDHEHATVGGINALRSTTPPLAVESTDTILRRWEVAEARHFKRFERKEISLEEHRRERLRETFSEFCADLSDAKLDDLYNVYLRGYESQWRLYPDAATLLENLKDTPTAIVTNGPGPLQRAKLNRLGLGNRFDAVIVSTEIGFAKPDKRIFDAALDALRMPARSCTFIGDNFLNDVAGAAAAGLRAVWINRFGAPTIDHSVAHRSIRSLLELLS